MKGNNKSCGKSVPGDGGIPIRGEIVERKKYLGRARMSRPWNSIRNSKMFRDHSGAFNEFHRSHGMMSG